MTGEAVHVAEAEGVGLDQVQLVAGRPASPGWARWNRRRDRRRRPGPGPTSTAAGRGRSGRCRSCGRGTPGRSASAGPRVVAAGDGDLPGRRRTAGWPAPSGGRPRSRTAVEEPSAPSAGGSAPSAPTAASAGTSARPTGCRPTSVRGPRPVSAHGVPRHRQPQRPVGVGRQPVRPDRHVDPVGRGAANWSRPVLLHELRDDRRRRGRRRSRRTGSAPAVGGGHPRRPPPVPGVRPQVAGVEDEPLEQDGDHAEVGAASSASKYHHSYPPGAVTACHASGTGRRRQHRNRRHGGVARACGPAAPESRHRAGAQRAAQNTSGTGRSARRRATRRAAGSRRTFRARVSRARPPSTSYRWRSIAPQDAGCRRRPWPPPSNRDPSSASVDQPAGGVAVEAPGPADLEPHQLPERVVHDAGRQVAPRRTRTGPGPRPAGRCGPRRRSSPTSRRMLVSCIASPITTACRSAAGVGQPENPAHDQPDHAGHPVAVDPQRRPRSRTGSPSGPSGTRRPARRSRPRGTSYRRTVAAKAASASRRLVGSVGRGPAAVHAGVHAVQHPLDPRRSRRHVAASVASSAASSSSRQKA